MQAVSLLYKPVCWGRLVGGAHVWNPLLYLLCPSLGTVTGAWTGGLLPFLSTSSQAMERISAMLLAGAWALEGALMAAGGCWWHGAACLAGR